MLGSVRRVVSEGEPARMETWPDWFATAGNENKDKAHLILAYSLVEKRFCQYVFIFSIFWPGMAQATEKGH